jgi:hypothetical protein
LEDVAAELFEARDKSLSPEQVMDRVRRAHNMLTAHQLAQRQAMLNAVSEDLKRIKVDEVPGGRTYQATALWLAGVIDKRGGDDGPSTTAKLADQLTKVMQALTKKGGGDTDDGYGSFENDISTPSR